MHRGGFILYAVSDDCGLRKALKVVGNKSKRARAAAVQRFFEEYASQLERADSRRRPVWAPLRGMGVDVKLYSYS